MTKFFFRLGSFLLVITGFQGLVYAQSDDTTREFEIIKKYRQERVQDFYSRLNEIDKQDYQRRLGENEKREQRKRIAEEYEKSRQQFVKERKAKPPEDPTAFEQELKARNQAHELARKQFVKARDDMSRILKRTGDIPEEDEYDLYFYDEDAAGESSP